MPPDALTDLSHLYVLVLPDSADVGKVVEALNAVEGMVFAEPEVSFESLTVPEPRPLNASGDQRAGAMLNPNDPRFLNDSLLSGGDWSVRATGAWDIQPGWFPTAIGFLENSGIYHTDPDWGSLPRIEQWDFDHGDGDAWPDADHDDPTHGSKVVGVAAAQTNNGIGVAGVCGGFDPNPGCKILFGKFWSNGELIAAINWTVVRGAKVINHSGCPASDSHALFLAYRNAYLSGSLITTGTGNVRWDVDHWQCGQSDPAFRITPARYDDVTMPVGGTKKNGQRFVNPNGLSQSAYYPAVVAPYSAWTVYGFGTYEIATGTSIAAPYVAGLAGLIFSEAAIKNIPLSHWDVRKLIEGTARQNTAFYPDPPGFNSETGWGIIDATKALQALQPPNQITIGAVTPGASAQCYLQEPVVPTQFEGDNVNLYARRCEVRAAVTFARQYLTLPLVWGRPHASGGVHGRNPNMQVLFTEVVPGTATMTGATLRTYVYETWQGGSPAGWWPRAPSQVTLEYAVLGNSPFVVTATAPTLVTVKATQSLTGAATDPASSWLWEQSYNGGPYGFWSNQQNSSFVSYAGTYTLGWRLSATRPFDSARDTAWATTQVCIPMGPSCYQVRAASESAHAGAPNTAGNGRTAGDHFGSGLWIAVPDAAQPRLIRAYAFDGHHDSSTSAVPWPNILERDGGDWTYPMPAGALTFATQRYPAGTDRFLLRVNGRITGPARSLALALAADPDLGDPGDDALGFDADLGLVWAHDSATGRHVGYLSLTAGVGSSVQQFGAGLDDAPESFADAARLMIAPTRVASGELADVRFLLSSPEVSVRGDGGFDATFAVLHAGTETDLLDLARATRRDAAALLASIPGHSLSRAPDVFGLRQSLGVSSLAASGAGSSASAVAQLQAAGVTALDYSVPAGRDVTVRIRLYNSRGQLVRTLVEQQVTGGDYHIEWDRLNERGARVPPGVYVAIMEAGAFRATRKLVVTH